MREGDGPEGGGLLRPLRSGAPYLRDCPPGIHHHAVAYRGGYGTDPFERFDTCIEAESFANDPEMVRKYGRMEAVECSRTLSLCRAEGGRP